MNKLKIFSIGACVALCMGFASCENDEPGSPIVDEYGILIFFNLWGSKCCVYL